MSNDMDIESQAKIFEAIITNPFFMILCLLLLEPGLFLGLLCLPFILIFDFFRKKSTGCPYCDKGSIPVNGKHILVNSTKTFKFPALCRRGEKWG